MHYFKYYYNETIRTATSTVLQERLFSDLTSVHRKFSTSLCLKTSVGPAPVSDAGSFYLRCHSVATCFSHWAGANSLLFLHRGSLLAFGLRSPQFNLPHAGEPIWGAAFVSTELLQWNGFIFLKYEASSKSMRLHVCSDGWPYSVTIIVLKSDVATCEDMITEMCDCAWCPVTCCFISRCPSTCYLWYLYLW